MSNEHNIGKFCSVAKKGTYIYPKEIPGYEIPEPQILEEDGQVFNFEYRPIRYGIEYNANGGECMSLKHQYTVEDEDYYPPAASKEGFTFLGWEPECIPKGSYGEKVFTAKWKANATLVNGTKLKQAFKRLAGDDVTTIMAIQQAKEAPESNYENISCTNNPILAYYDSGIIYIYSKDPIFCNKNMAYAFNEFTILRDISFLKFWNCPTEADIHGLFKNCALLADVSAVENWANGVFSNYSDAFTGTIAIEAGRVPSWYTWDVTINYVSKTGKILKSANHKVIPNIIVYPKSFGGYNSVTEKIKITAPDSVYTFEYEPIVYDITYDTDGGELLNPKTTYTIEDATYYPPAPYKPGYTFKSWYPECIDQGEYGNASFVAHYTM